MPNTVKVIAVSTGILLIVYLTCSLPIMLKYSDGLQATDTKRNYLLFATLVPLSMAIIGPFVIFLICSLQENCSKACLCTLVVTVIVTLTISISVGIVYGKRFEAIPNHCATKVECQSRCTGINKDLHQELHAPFFNDNDVSCGHCSCICSEYPGKKCTPVENPHFGMNSYSKTVGSLISLILSLLVILLLTAAWIRVLGHHGNRWKFVGIYIGTAIFILLACALPIDITYSDGSHAANAKRNTLLTAVLVPVVMTIFGLFVVIYTAIWFPKFAWASDDYDIRKKVYWAWLLLFVVLIVSFVSVPVGVEFGTRFASVPDTCVTAECFLAAGISISTKIALSLLSGMTAMSICFHVIWWIKYKEKDADYDTDDREPLLPSTSREYPYGAVGHHRSPSLETLPEVTHNVAVFPSKVTR